MRHSIYCKTLLNAHKPEKNVKTNRGFLEVLFPHMLACHCSLLLQALGEKDWDASFRLKDIPAARLFNKTCRSASEMLVRGMLHGFQRRCQCGPSGHPKLQRIEGNLIRATRHPKLDMTHGRWLGSTIPEPQK